MESRRKRVEQKGRFTITEIIPASPCSRLSSPTFQDDAVSVVDFPAADTPTPSGSSGDLASIQPAPPQQKLPSFDSVELPIASGAMDALVKAEEPPETHTQPAEAVTALVDAGMVIDANMEVSAMDSTSEVSTPTAASATPAVIDSPSQKFSSPKKAKPSARRIKRRGRFTIIELASDSPTSRKNADDLYDHRFVTTTSISANPVDNTPQLGNQLSRSFDNAEHRTKTKPKSQRVARSMPRLQQPSSARKSRRRSESPTRELAEPMDMVDPSGNQQQQQEANAAAYASLQALPETESVDALSSVALAAVTVASTGATETSITTAPVLVRSTTPTSQLLQSNGGIVGSSQAPITISAAQFLQQQQTIASLIRQQHDLKQIISVLQEQQHQLMTIPSQINELKRQQTGFNNTDEETRELYMQVDTLTRANESLQLMLNAAERDARHRSLEIECLSEENDELRHRCGQLESRYIDERKQGFVLEEELQRLRMLSLTQQEQQLHQQQEQHQKLGNSQSGVAVE